jgi:competence protein CoiA
MVSREFLMLYAMDGSIRIVATPKARAQCPDCGEPVIAKCGDIVTWHWAHLAGGECDAWAEGETEWHREWKSRFKNVEVTIRRGDEWHRADAVTESGWVVEFQHSPISPREIQEREKFYRRMIWVFDARDARRPIKSYINGVAFRDYRLLLYSCDDNRAETGYCTFRWKHARKSISVARATTYLDLGDGWLLKIGKIYFDGICAGWGHLVSHSDFVSLR